jgi:hypothetical protein
VATRACPHVYIPTQGIIEFLFPFLRQVAGLWSEEKRDAFVDCIAANPEAGDVIPDDAVPLYLLLIYAKAQREDLTPDHKRRVRALVTSLKQAHRRR